MLQQVRFNGAMNLDDKPDVINTGSHISALNGRFYGTSQGLTFQNTPGNVLVNNSSLPATGTNICIGGFYDQVNKRVIFFNYNSGGKNGIYYYDFSSNAVTKIFLSFTDSATDILNFSPDYPIHSAAIIYRPTSDGDLLYWTDGLNRPRYINISTVATLAPFTEAMINAGKDAPTKPPANLSFQSDLTIPFNSVKNKMFRFAYRWVYVNNEKSTFSPTSIVPITNVADPNADIDPTVDNYIQLDIYAGSTTDNYAIELFGQISNGSTWGEFFQIDTFVLSEYSIAFGGTFTFKFYNNGSYVFIDPKESDLYYSYLPDLANTLESLNGNVIIYGGITDGYDPLLRSEVNVSVTSSLVTATGKDVYAWRWASDQVFGLVYFDERGKTNGVVSFPTDSGIDTNNFKTTTPSYTGELPAGYGTVPQINASINHTPPTWAVAYQWVRVNLTPKFLHWVTIDVQSDDNYVYFCIQNLIEFNTNNGFLPSYEFAEGDRLKILANVGIGVASSVPVSPQQDYPILGVVQRVMVSPASNGTFLKVPKLTIPSGGFTTKMLIEVYTPLARTSATKQIFYEWGERYAIYESGGARYHRGQIQDQTASQPATFQWTNGDVYVKYRAYPQTLPLTNTTTLYFLYMMSSMWNDYVPSESNSNGRAWVIDPNAGTIYRPVQSRWGQNYQQDTNINGINIFYPDDFDTYDLSKGAIRRFKVRDRIMRVFQERACGEVGVYTKFIKDSAGTTILETSDTIITTNNIQYYKGEFGMGTQPCSLVSGTIQDYFCDPVRGYQLRVSSDGVTPISALYKGQFYIRNLILPYNQTITKTNGFKSYIMGAYNYFDEEYVCVLPGGQPPVLYFQIGSTNERFTSQTWDLSFSGTPVAGDIVALSITNGTIREDFSYSCVIGDTTQTVSSALVDLINHSLNFSAVTRAFGLQHGLRINSNAGVITVTTTITLISTPIHTTFSFNEKRNAYCSFFSYHPEWIVSCEDLIISFVDGKLYTHNSPIYANYYGTQYGCYIQVPFNQNLTEKKSWMSVYEVSDSKWPCTDIYTNAKSYGSQRQETTLVSDEFTLLEQMASAAIKRDVNSRGGKVNGDFIKGNYLVAKFEMASAPDLVFLNEVGMVVKDSPLTVVK